MDSVWTHVLPISKWGKLYGVIPFKFGNKMRLSVTARTKNTTFFIGNQRFSTFNGKLHQWFELLADNCFLVEANQPIAVALLTMDVSDAGPVMLQVPAVEQYLWSYNIPIPYNEDNDLAFRVSLFIVADRLTTVFILNGHRWAVPDHYRRKLENFFDREFFCFKVPVATRLVTISSENFHRFGVMVYGPSAISSCSFAFSLHNLEDLRNQSSEGFLPVDIPLLTTTTQRPTTVVELQTPIAGGQIPFVIDATEESYYDSTNNFLWIQETEDYSEEVQDTTAEVDLLDGTTDNETVENIVPETELSSAPESDSSKQVIYVTIAVIAVVVVSAGAIESNKKMKAKKQSKSNSPNPSNAEEPKEDNNDENNQQTAEVNKENAGAAEQKGNAAPKSVDTGSQKGVKPASVRNVQIPPPSTEAAVNDSEEPARPIKSNVWKGKLPPPYTAFGQPRYNNNYNPYNRPLPPFPGPRPPEARVRFIEGVHSPRFPSRFPQTVAAQQGGAAVGQPRPLRSPSNGARVTNHSNQQ